MFRTAPVAEPAPGVMAPADDGIPISLLALDLGEAPAEGWAAHLINRGVVVELDDVGRPSVTRGDARMLIAERAEAEARRREAAAAAEPQAVEADRVRRASIWRGAPAVEGVPAAAAMLQADKDAQPRRTSVLQHALANSGELVFHPIRDEGDGS